MSRTLVTIKDPHGRPVTKTAAARQIIRDYVAENFPNTKPARVHVRKLDDKGNYTATI